MVKDEKELMSTPVGVVRDPAFFRKVKGVEVLTETEAVAIDRQNRKVTLQNTAGGDSSVIEYDALILA